jgi:hypothetical protein
MPLVWGEPDNVARMDFLDGFAFVLSPANSVSHNQGLA